MHRALILLLINVAGILCTGCLRGYFPDPDSPGACLACGEGTYKPDIGDHACSACPQGLFLDDGVVGATACLGCPADSFYVLDYTDAAAVVGGSAVLQGNLDASERCLRCPPGSSTYGATGAASALDCICTAGWAAPSGRDPGVMQSDLAFAYNYTCLRCSYGQPFLCLVESVVAMCPAGQVSNAANDACMCQGELVLNGEGLCAPCPAATAFHASDALQTNPGVCVPCREGESTDEAGRCMCAPGFEPHASPNAVVEVRLHGALKAKLWYDELLPGQPLPNLTNFSESWATYSDPRLAEALHDIGFASEDAFAFSIYPVENAVDCHECSLEQYKNGTGNTACSACPAHARTQSLGATSRDQCACEAGYWSPEFEVCSVCPANYHCPGGSTRVPCTQQSTSLPGSSSPEACICDAGYYKWDGLCAVCKEDHYCPTDEDNALPCPEHSFTVMHPTAVALEDCKCLSGYEASGGECVPCRADTYKAADSGDMCELCPGNSSTLGLTGAQNVQKCICADGFMPVATPEYRCGECDAGAFCFTEERQLCPSGSTSPPGSSSSADCYCVSGYWESNATEAGPPECHACPANSGSPANSLSAAQCSCFAGFWQSNVTDQGEPVCQACPPGHYCAGGASAPVQCPVGSDTAGGGKSSKADCLCAQGEGHDDAFDCVPCAVGSFQPEERGQLCVPCAPGKTTAREGAYEAEQCFCAAGSFDTSNWDGKWWIPAGYNESTFLTEGTLFAEWASSGQVFYNATAKSLVLLPVTGELASIRRQVFM